MIRIEARPEPSVNMVYAAPLIAVTLTMIAGVFLFMMMGKDPGLALYTFFVEPVSNFTGIAELLVKATPLTLIGVGLSVGFRANVWNIGAEGQLTMG
ncbi:MAG: ABC transporter permease, partial [Rhodospirillales bacterium]|nr:ABC transporter permease [Rhodospirillales bacterium]